jgi:hypothetical protein
MMWREKEAICLARGCSKTKEGSIGVGTILEERSNFSFGEGKGHVLGRMLAKRCTYLVGSCFAVAKLGGACLADK